MLCVKIKDDLHPEDSAMLQALVSRDPGPVEQRFRKVESSGSGKFMDQYYIGYGHDSIGDCATTTVYIENVSLYAAKVIEDHMRFNGQEASTRYIDFSKQSISSYGYASEKNESDIEFFLDAYEKALTELKVYFRGKYPESKDKAIDACSFDVARSLLPVSVNTTVCWTTTLTGFRSHLLDMAIHPLREVKDIAREVNEKLYEHCPNSFYPDIDQDPRRIDIDKTKHIYGRWFMTPAQKMYLYDRGNDIEDLSEDILGIPYISNHLNDSLLRKHQLQGGPIPWWMDPYAGRVTFIDELDFASYRDLHRHRLAVTPLPLGEFTKRGGNEIFTESSPYTHVLVDALGENFVEDIRQHVRSIRVTKDEMDRLYALPMGVEIKAYIQATAAELSYILSLRSKKSVHPTLRDYIHRLYRCLDSSTQEFFDVDLTPAVFQPSDVRAKQTITEKGDGFI